MVSWLIFGFGGLSVESNRLHHYVILFFTDFLHWRRYFIIIHRHHCQKSRSTIHNWWCYTSQPKVRGSSRTLYALLKKILLFKTGVKCVLSTSKRRSMGCAGHSNWMMTRRTLPHPKLGLGPDQLFRPDFAPTKRKRNPWRVFSCFHHAFKYALLFAIKIKADLMNRMNTKKTPQKSWLANFFRPESRPDQVGAKPYPKPVPKTRIPKYGCRVRGTLQPYQHDI